MFAGLQVRGKDLLRTVYAMSWTFEMNDGSGIIKVRIESWVITPILLLRFVS